MIDLLSLGRDELAAFVAARGEKPYRARQLFTWLHQRRATTFDQMTDLKKETRAALAAVAAIRAPVVDTVREAKDGTRKYRLTTHDGHAIESVFIPDASGPGKNALCISSQVGCAMGCTFCATASMKLARNLTSGEIVGQLYAVLNDLDANVPRGPARATDPDASIDADDDDAPVGKLPRRVTNIVYMGMGEPLHNFDGVKGSIALLVDPQGQGYAPRRITVSTSGLVTGLQRLGDETDVHLAVSLNATTDDVRSDVMPVNKKWPIEELLAACRAFPLRARRRITFEYVLLQDVNDTDDDARRLVQLMQGMRGKVNLIPFNPHPLSPFGRPSDERVEAFRRILDEGRVSAFVRTTRGLDIDAACGMLGAQKLEQARGALPVL
jgi:23S rRNA (adenine2503-C2)-methyltransferase